MFIEEGIMNFWAMWFSIGSFTVSIIILLFIIHEKIKNRGESY